MLQRIEENQRGRINNPGPRAYKDHIEIGEEPKTYIRTESLEEDAV